MSGIELLARFDHPGSFSKDRLTWSCERERSVLGSSALRFSQVRPSSRRTAIRRTMRAGTVRSPRPSRERRVQAGRPSQAVRCPRVRTAGVPGEAGKIRFTSASCRPTWAKPSRSRSLALPYRRASRRATRGPGLFWGNAPWALGQDGPRSSWQGELARWESATSRPGASRFLGRAASIQPRMASSNNRILVIIGADQLGFRKELWPSPTAARAPSRGASCCSISSGGREHELAVPPGQNWLLTAVFARATARRASSRLVAKPEQT